MAPSPLSIESSILIIGAGTWGCSTALDIARRGYKHVTVLDPHPVPSPIAAGNDINKIMEHNELKDGEPDSRSIAFATFTRAALNAWKTDPVFQPFFHETGAIVSGHTPALLKHIQEDEIDPSETAFVQLETAEDFRGTMPAGVLTGDFPGWKGWWRKDGAGWIHAKKAMVSAFSEARRLGVTFVTGSPEGNVDSLAYEGGDVIGARTADGKLHRADYTILSAGAGSDMLLDFKKQLRPTAWTLCHIQMTPEEAARYRNLPVLFNIAKGFFMEPDADNHELKICDEHPGYCNFLPDPDRPGETRSIPFAKHQIPLEAEARARDFLRDTMPHLAERPLSFARICWDADTPDRAFLIDKHPEYPSLVVAVGGSGNGAMQMPTIGGFIADALEGSLQKDLKDVVRWRPETAVGRDWRATQNRFGGPGQIMDFQNLEEGQWTRIKV
ncbi:NAD(P)/FAD-dependent oxidoreductase [Aspergillus clavatus NRRL 1]|uniref:Fructosyl amine:oxygen oxidoreductase n=1 Tax=Aspergillus clavatus (strain ATCC 1007 / CBS 513.65 / DSM 816 / NCTC 3887 / NRRL 1 / QM 1276 / 107) TaxID=344612 RepID=A1CFD2_ASPCL|nr:fructosyl amine:oxygen oxidoreductase [Aspergillus clavatus NRRL 1]EAW11581.1 fructosyl amine:oxygen oxidoreductase [Aspergillus clavatus NRRL 1]